MRNFNNIKVGDKVVVCSSNGYHWWNGERPQEVTRVTKSYFEVDGNLYRKDNGECRGGGLYSCYCVNYTQEIIDECKAKRARLNNEKTFKNAYHCIGWFSNDALAEIASVIKKYTDAENINERAHV